MKQIHYIKSEEEARTMVRILQGKNSIIKGELEENQTRPSINFSILNFSVDNDS